MSKFISRKYLFPIILFCLLDILAVGAGMGVPIFAILLGFIIGWRIPPFFISDASDMHIVLRKCLIVSFLTSSLTFLLMIIIWGPITRMLFDPSADLANFGIPLILYDPKASFIGWIVLMIIISPVLQALTTAFSASVRIAWRTPNLLKE